jgi:hypothetical protein
MPKNGKSSSAAIKDDGFLITPDVGGPDIIVERVVTVRSMPLPECSIAEVEMIQISEKTVPLPSSRKTTAVKRTRRQA